MTLLFLSLLTFGASFIGTIAGFGSSTIMLPIVALHYPLPEALLLVGLIHAFNDLWEVILVRAKLNWRILLLFGIPGIILSAIGANIAFIVPQQIASQILGVVLIGSVLVINFDKKLVIPNTDISYWIGGSISGFLAGIFGIGGPVRSLFLTSYNLPKKMYFMTIGILSLSVDATRIITYAIGGATLPQTLGTKTLILIPLSFVAAECAERVVDKIPQQKFRVVISGFLILAGLVFLIAP